MKRELNDVHNVLLYDISWTNLLLMLFMWPLYVGRKLSNFTKSNSASDTANTSVLPQALQLSGSIFFSTTRQLYQFRSLHPQFLRHGVTDPLLSRNKAVAQNVSHRPNGYVFEAKIAMRRLRSSLDLSTSPPDPRCIE